TNCLPYFPYPARLRYTNPKVITVQEDVDPNDVFHPISVNPPDAESWENVNLSIGSSDSSDAENDQVRSPYNTESNSPELTSTDHLFHEPYLNLPTKSSEALGTTNPGGLTPKVIEEDGIDEMLVQSVLSTHEDKDALERFLADS
ncbi:hypothetical protein FBUS_05683, partial [Fasciolopsis buskii]